MPELAAGRVAAEWVLNRLPQEHQPVMQRAKSICLGEEKEYWEDLEGFIKPCADFVLDNITAQASHINYDGPNNSIVLAEGSP